MKKALSLILALTCIVMILPLHAQAASASFSITGPSVLRKGETGTYTVNVTVQDAAAAQAILNYDGAFFELVSGNINGVWDTASNTNGTYALTSVTLRCKGEVGTSGSLSLSGVKVSRFTGSVPPSESLSCGGASLNVVNPVPTPTPSPTPVPTPTPIPTARPTGPKATQSVRPSASPTSAPTSSPTCTPLPSATTTPGPWTLVEEEIGKAGNGGHVRASMGEETVMPSSVLEQLREKQATLTLDFAGYTCTIDGTQLQGDVFQELDLYVDQEKEEALSQATGGLDLYRLRFRPEGELPGLFVYTMNVPDSQPGDAVYLYTYYETAGVWEGLQCATVDEEGRASFFIYHGGDYFLTSSIPERAFNLFPTQEPEQEPAPEEKPSGITLSVYLSSLAGTAIVCVFLTMCLIRFLSQQKGRHKN